LPYYETVRGRLDGEDQGYIWEKTYSTYKDKKYEICELDLKILPLISTVGDLDTGEQRMETK
jgi:hypothetical protein